MIWRSHGKGWTTCAVREWCPDKPAWRVSVYGPSADAGEPPVAQFWGTQNISLKNAAEFISRAKQMEEK